MLAKRLGYVGRSTIDDGVIDKLATTCQTISTKQIIIFLTTYYGNIVTNKK